MYLTFPLVGPAESSVKSCCNFQFSLAKKSLSSLSFHTSSEAVPGQPRGVLSPFKYSSSFKIFDYTFSPVIDDFMFALPADLKFSSKLQLFAFNLSISAACYFTNSFSSSSSSAIGGGIVKTSGSGYPIGAQSSAKYFKDLA